MTMLAWRLRQAHQVATSDWTKALLVAVGFGGLWLNATHPGFIVPVGWALLILVSVGSARVGWGIADGIILWPHRRHRVDPLAYALRPILGYPGELPAAKFIRWDRDFGQEHTAIRVVLPRHYVGSDEARKELLRAVREKCGLSEDDVNHKFVLQGRWSFLQITPREKLLVPQIVRVSDVRELLEESVSGHPLLALGKGGEPIRGDLDGDAPHIGLSMRTGKGKSNTIRGIVAQEMHLGASAVICDLKRRSLRCFKGLEGVTYCRDVGEIHNALIAVAREAMERNVLADELGDDQEPPWQRRIVVMEEQNTTISALIDYWQDIRESGDAKVSPAVRAYQALLNMGRQVNVHVIAAFQKLTARAAGGTENRDQFGMIIMSGFKPASWKMLADEIPMPKVAGKPRGRSWFVCDGEAPEGQTVYWTEREAREWAASGKSSKRVAGRDSVAEAVSLGKRPARVAGAPKLTVVPDDAGEETRKLLVTISQASADKGKGIVPMTHQSLRAARVRDPEFPEPDAIEGQAKLYQPETLQRWARNREVAGRTG